jgi:hypothetical protein
MPKGTRRMDLRDIVAPLLALAALSALAALTLAG